MEVSINISDEELQYLVFCNVVKLGHLNELNFKIQSHLENIKTKDKHRKRKNCN